MATCSLKTLKNSIFGVFLENDTLPEIFQNSVPKGFIATLIDVLCSNFVKFDRRETGKIVRCLPDKKKISPGSPALASARIEPKICRGQPPTMYSECSKSAHFRRSYIRTREHYQSALENESNIRLKPIFKPNNKATKLSYTRISVSPAYRLRHHTANSLVLFVVRRHCGR